MIYEKIKLFEDREKVYLQTYCADKLGDKARAAILVIPGGGYFGVCDNREGEPIAMSFMAKGVNAFVLHYSVAEDAGFPKVLIEASAAMKYIKDNAERYNIDPEKVFVTGFSAGGHLCASLGILWHLSEVQNALDMEYGYNKPAGIIPVYPVITPFTPDAHLGSFHNLLKDKNPSEDLLAECALDRHVDEKSAPAFIVHTSNDQVVTVHNALRLATAYADCNMKFELHIFPDAPHGVALGNDITSMGNEAWVKPEIAKWVDMAVDWMNNPHSGCA